jgi:hypothetical protein
MSEWYYIVGAYALTYIVLAAYVVRLRLLRRRATAAGYLEHGGGR